MSAPEQSHGNEDVRFEPTDVATRPVALSVLTLAVFTLIFTFIGHLVYYGLASREQAASPEASPMADKYAAKEPPAPRLQVDPKKDLDDHRAAEDRILTTFGWVDQNAGTVRVPIERAMEMVVAQGLPARQHPVPSRMEPVTGVAPRQYPEGSGAPDWHSPAGQGGHSQAEEAHGH